MGCVGSHSKALRLMPWYFQYCTCNPFQLYHSNPTHETTSWPMTWWWYPVQTLVFIKVRVKPVQGNPNLPFRRVCNCKVKIKGIISFCVIQLSVSGIEFISFEHVLPVVLYIMWIYLWYSVIWYSEQNVLRELVHSAMDRWRKFGR